MNLALQVFNDLIARRDQLKQMSQLNPAQWEELKTVEELIAALAGANDTHTIAQYASALSHRKIIQ